MLTFNSKRHSFWTQKWEIKGPQAKVLLRRFIRPSNKSMRILASICEATSCFAKLESCRMWNFLIGDYCFGPFNCTVHMTWMSTNLRINHIKFNYLAYGYSCLWLHWIFSFKLAANFLLWDETFNIDSMTNLRCCRVYDAPRGHPR